MATRRLGYNHDSSSSVSSIGRPPEDASSFLSSIGRPSEDVRGSYSPIGRQPADATSSVSSIGRQPEDASSSLTTIGRQPEDERSSYSPIGQNPSSVELTEAEKEQQRLRTYTHWNGKKSAAQLASAGFIYTGIGDKVECESCGIRLYNWQTPEDPIQAHKKYAPECEFMLTRFPQIKVPRKPTQALTIKYPHYSSYQSRMDSFEDWPLKCVAQKPEMMARSGFFYFGSADRARCFHCGVTLRDWDTDDYPPCAHKQWSVHCPFVQTLDVVSMTEEIEEWERMERMRVEYESSTFFDCSSSLRAARDTVVADGNVMSRADNSQQLSSRAVNSHPVLSRIDNSQQLSSRGDNFQHLSSTEDNFQRLYSKGENSQTLSSRADNSKQSPPLTARSPAFVALVEMGYLERDIYKAAEVRRSEGCLNPDAMSLLTVILDKEL